MRQASTTAIWQLCGSRDRQLLLRVVRRLPTRADVHACRSFAGQALDKPQGRKPRELRHEGRHGTLLLYGDLNSLGAVIGNNGSVTDPMMGGSVAG